MGTDNKPRVPRSGSGSTRLRTSRHRDASETSAGTPGAGTAEAGVPVAGDTMVEEVARRTPVGEGRTGREPAAPKDSVVKLPRSKRWRRRRNWLIGLGTAVVVIGGLIAAVIFTPIFAVKNIVVDGAKLASESTILKELDSLMQVPLPQISTEEVHSLVSDVRQVRDVSIEASPPSTLVVHIEERVPVAVLKDGNDFKLIDEEGTRLATVEDRADAPYPLIDGDQEDLGEDIFRATTAVLAALPADILGKLEHASADSLDSVELTLENGKRVLWGNAERSKLKAKVLGILLEETKAKPEEGEQLEPQPPIEVYDVSAPKRPVTR